MKPNVPRKKRSKQKAAAVRNKDRSCCVTAASSPHQEQQQQQQQRQHLLVVPAVSVLDLTKVPDQTPILKHEYSEKGFHDNYRNHRIDPELASKYVGVSYDRVNNKWRAQMMIHGKVHNLGCYINEEEAGTTYAKAAYIYKQRRAPSGSSGGIYSGFDLRTVPDQPLLLNERYNRDSATSSKYKGVKYCKGRWQARISEGSDKCIHLGTFDTMEEAAQIFAKATYYLEHKSTTESSHQIAVQIVEEHILGVKYPV